MAGDVKGARSGRGAQMGANRSNTFRILFTAIASGVVDMDDSMCETSDDESQNRHCPGLDIFDIDVTDYSWRPCRPKDSCPKTGMGLVEEKQFA